MQTGDPHQSNVCEILIIVFEFNSQAFVNDILGATYDYEKLTADCTKELGYEHVEFDDIWKKRDKKAGDVMLCVMKKTGNMKDSIIDKEQIIKTMEEFKNQGIIGLDDNAREAIRKCVDEGNKASEENEKVIVFVTCAVNYLQKRIQGNVGNEQQ